ncbi:hypothetical protein QA601_12950 [Chitinispirillales bacterium ANBcel5]|uniref:hypothetical protein n=1 Tax=Cellulosispirillum alkaliphilum TaxID=3039283 RepID=UPI002A5178CA|nr:hypothetical protein [Chitinispirillales bacterium ANBcel5]
MTEPIEEEKGASFFSHFTFLPEYYFYTDIISFHNQKNKLFEEVYFFESNTKFEAMFFSYKEDLFFGTFFMTILGMGKQYEDIVLDPRDVYYALTPFFELRRWDLTLQAGLDHRCIHEVDRKTGPTIYWNQLYTKIASRVRPGLFQWHHKNQEVPWDPMSRLSWSFSFGYYLPGFFGLIRPALVNGGHNMRFESIINLKYALHRTDSWLFSTSHMTRLNLNENGTGYWSGMFGLEATVNQSGNGLTFFTRYNYDFPRERPFYSKDKLIELGMRFFF